MFQDEEGKERYQYFSLELMHAKSKFDRCLLDLGYLLITNS